MKPLHIALVFAVLLSLLITYLHLTLVTRSLASASGLSASELFHEKFQRCLAINAFDLTVRRLDVCHVRLSFHRDTQPAWRDRTTGELEGLAHEFNLCQVLNDWEQVGRSTSILTEEFLEALPDGWHTYAWRRINKGDQLNKCQNVTRCKEKLALVLPKVPPFKPRQFGRCAVVGNSGDLLLSKFGKDIDSHDVVIRNNGAPTRGFSLQVGEKSTFRLLNRGSAKALDKVVELAGDEKEVLIIKTTIHDVMSKLIQEVPIRNPVYLLLGMQFGAAAKGTGLKALQFALSVCETVDMYGFTVDPGYTNWTRYFSESRGGHAPLQARAYYHMMECLGLVTIHSPLREQRGHVVTEVPSRSLLTGAIRSSMSLNNKQWGASIDPFESCSIWATRASKLSEDHTGNLSKAHFAHDCGLAMYPMPTSSGRQMLCISNKVANVEC